MIHPTAVVHEGAFIAGDASIGPYCIIGDGVRISPGVRLMNNVVVEGDTEVGPETVIYPFAYIGGPPQDLKYHGEKTGVRIGRGNTIREYVTVHRGSVGGEGFTVVGDSNYIMAYAHIAHDCKVGSNIVMANAASLSGHVEVQDHAILGGIIGVHQFVRIGAYSMTGAFSGIAQDIPPFTLASGSRAKLYGLNLVGLRRHGFSKGLVDELAKAYKILFRSKQTMKDAIEKAVQELPASPELERLLEFVKTSRRGICKSTASRVDF